MKMIGGRLPGFQELSFLKLTAAKKGPSLPNESVSVTHLDGKLMQELQSLLS
jgi:hypothetical protein